MRIQGSITIMRTLRRFLALAFLALCGSDLYGQIGYQVSVLDQATGVPRANENVSVLIELSNSAGEVILAESKSAVTNDFGVVSLQIGSESTFAGMDWSKLPLFISATVDGVLIGKSQVLTVPVAEYAKQTGTLTIEELCGKKWSYNGNSYSFHKNGTFNYITEFDSTQGHYEIEGNNVYLRSRHEEVPGWHLHYFPTTGKLVSTKYGGEYE